MFSKIQNIRLGTPHILSHHSHLKDAKGVYASREKRRSRRNDPISVEERQASEGRFLRVPV
jgi:hypothetical protein